MRESRGGAGGAAATRSGDDMMIFFTSVDDRICECKRAFSLLAAASCSFRSSSSVVFEVPPSTKRVCRSSFSLFSLASFSRAAFRSSSRPAICSLAKLSSSASSVWSREPFASLSDAELALASSSSWVVSSSCWFALASSAFWDFSSASNSLILFSDAPALIGFDADDVVRDGIRRTRGAVELSPLPRVGLGNVNGDVAAREIPRVVLGLSSSLSILLWEDRGGDLVTLDVGEPPRPPLLGLVGFLKPEDLAVLGFRIPLEFDLPTTLRTFSAFWNVPCFARHLKYWTPFTVPSFLPNGLSRAMPTHVPEAN
mmetsp:Transcript_31553/g.60931  ORF Transcript_31553/g.60931 Transcript_31553/m.60931 type:complete len:312 (+) Transcript_31553:4089-5024(+)